MAYGLSSYELTVLVIAVFLVVIGIGLGLYTRSRLQRRKAQLLDELQKRPDLVQDRAFNRISMARREADLLAQQGTDVERARERIAEAQAAFDNRHFEQAYQTAQVAHESLVGTRRGRRPLPSSTPRPATSGNHGPAPSKGNEVPLRVRTPSPTVPPSGPPVTKNRAESQFQLRVLDQELSTARTDHPDTPSTTEAGGLASQAHSAFDRSDFTEAFRLALKGRRALGGSVESLPPTAGGLTVPPMDLGPIGTNGNGASPSDGSDSGEARTGAERCPDCGHPALADDAFCRGCGRPRSPSSCSKCGAPRTRSDTFCGRCGARFA